MANHNYLILDACVLINLLATGVIEQILESSAQESSICILVQNESFFLRNEIDINESIPINLQPFIESELIKICNLETEIERQMFVNFAAKLDDGEAMSLAIALSRNWDIATDDRKARKTFVENAKKEQKLTSTSSLIKEWVEVKNVSNQEVKNILLKIEKSARYRPADSDQNYKWWSDVLLSCY